jgi:hypothetical protein
MMRYRVALPLIVASLYGGLFLLRSAGYQELYDNLLYGLGIIPFKFPFVDTHGILAPAQCYREGISIYPTNPCDVLLRPLPYSPLWLDLVPAFMTTADTPALGVGFNLTFLGGLFMVLRPTTWREFVLMAVACTSTCVTFAVERGNADLLMFALAALTVVLYGQGPTARLGAYAVGFVGGLLKFYPFVLLALALREMPKRFLLVAATTGIGLVAFVVYYYSGLLDALGAIPHGAYFGDPFSALNLPFGIGELRYGDAFAHAVLAILIAVFLAASVFLARSLQAERSPLDWERLEVRSLLAGSLLIVGCFFAGQNDGYRGIHLLLVLPGLLLLHHSIGKRRLRGSLRLTIVVVPLLMWEEGIRHSFEFGLRSIRTEDSIPGVPSIIFWVIRELAWWWVVSVLATIVILFAAQSPLGRQFAKAVRRVSPRLNGMPGSGSVERQANRPPMVG